MAEQNPKLVVTFMNCCVAAITVFGLASNIAIWENIYFYIAYAIFIVNLIIEIIGVWKRKTPLLIVSCILYCINVILLIASIVIVWVIFFTIGKIDWGALFFLIFNIVATTFLVIGISLQVWSGMLTYRLLKSIKLGLNGEASTALMN